MALALGGLLLVVSPGHAPAAILAALATCAFPLRRAWRGAEGTALRAAIVWGTLAVALGAVAQALAWAEPLATGRPLAGHACYLMVLAVLAALISVLNARTPGGGAWAILMLLLVLVFLIPWLEGPGMARRAHGGERLHLAAPWTIFYGLLVVAGVTNYLPTRYAPAAGAIGLGLGLEYLALTRTDWTLDRRGMIWSAVPWSLALALWLADRRAGHRPRVPQELGRAWAWFRDHWGVVWALRVQERFNRTAEAQRWPVRLSWFGVTVPPGQPGEGPVGIPPAAEATFRMLLRRFADPARVEAAAVSDASDPCQPAGRGS